MTQPEEDLTPSETPPPFELFLLSPFRLPAQSSLYLANEDVACFLHGHAVLWHPALLLAAAGLPRIASPYDHEQPSAGHVYAIPEHPPLVLPDDWDDRVRAAGALAFRAGLERPQTLLNLRDGLLSILGDRAEAPAIRAVLDLPTELVVPFFGLGFGFAHLEALCEAMNHENIIDRDALWLEVRQAVVALADGHNEEACRRHLETAAQRLLTAREVLYPVTIHVVDLALLNARSLEHPLPLGLDKGLPVNVLASALMLEALGSTHPERLALLKERLAEDKAEVIGGIYVEREDALLPVESQLWNLTTGLAICEEILGKPVKIHGRQRFAYHPHLPTLLQAAGLTRTLFLTFDESSLPTHRSAVVNWSSTDGKHVDAFCRAPHAADAVQTFFHVAHYLHETIMQDHVAVLGLLHHEPACAFYGDWLELAKLSPVLGQWTTLTAFLDEVSAGDYASPTPADDFHGDYLSERTANPDEPNSADYYSSSQTPKLKLTWSSVESRRHPVSAFAAHARTRRRVDAAWTFAAIQRALAGKNDTLQLFERLQQLEDQSELTAPCHPSAELNAALDATLQEAAQALAERLVSRAEKEQPGYMLLNPCGYSRRVALEIPDFAGPIPLTGPVKACQVTNRVGQLVVEVPALGFAWFPAPTGPGANPTARMKMADARCVRNEFFEAEVDPLTGGLKRISDMRFRIARLGQQLVYNPGATLKVKEVKTTSTGPAYGEIVTEGVLVNDSDEELATFRQRFRAWMGRPVLDLRIEIEPRHRPVGYPWHAYFGSRFAWRDERSLLLRGVQGVGYTTSQTRPESPDYLEMRVGRQNCVILTGGLPFHQRQGGRMVDVILIPEGEECRAFDLAIGLERDYPALTSQGMVSPVALVPVRKGPPHIGATGWLFHLDAPNLMLTSLRPAPDGADAIFARLTECGHPSGTAELRCARNPARALHASPNADTYHSPGINEDTVFLDPSQGELMQVRIDFTVEEPPVQEETPSLYE